MQPNADLHYCKWCKQYFRITLPERFSGDVMMACPHCSWRHYRHFALGEAIHCDIHKRHEDPQLIQGSKI